MSFLHVSARAIAAGLLAQAAASIFAPPAWAETPVHPESVSKCRFGGATDGCDTVEGWAGVRAVHDKIGTRVPDDWSPLEKLLEDGIYHAGEHAAQLAEELAVQRPPATVLRDRETARAANDKGLAALQINDFHVAAQAFEAGLRADGEDVELLNNLGYVYFLQNKLEDAAGRLREALLRDPKRVNAWANLGQVLAAQNKPDMAAACFAIALRLSSKPDKTLAFVRGLAEKDPSPALHEAVEKALRDQARYLAVAWDESVEKKDARAAEQALGATVEVFLARKANEGALSNQPTLLPELTELVKLDCPERENSVQLLTPWPEGGEALVLHTATGCENRGMYAEGFSRLFYRQNGGTGQRVWRGAPLAHWVMPLATAQSVESVPDKPLVVVHSEFSGADHSRQILSVVRWQEGNFLPVLKLELSDWCGQGNEWRLDKGVLTVPAAEASERCPARREARYDLRTMETLECSLDEAFDKPEDAEWNPSRHTELTLVMQEGRPIEVGYAGGNSNGMEGGYHACDYSASRNDGNSLWEDAGGKTVVRATGSGESPRSTLEIVPTDTGYQVNFTDMPYYYCGASAEFPKSVRLERGKDACQAEYAREPSENPDPPPVAP